MLIPGLMHESQNWRYPCEFPSITEGGLHKFHHSNLTSDFGTVFRSRLGCQVIAKPELDGMRLALPAATRNFAVDGHVPKPHGRDCLLRVHGFLHQSQFCSLQFVTWWYFWTFLLSEGSLVDELLGYLIAETSVWSGRINISVLYERTGKCGHRIVSRYLVLCSICCCCHRNRYAVLASCWLVVKLWAHDRRSNFYFLGSTQNLSNWTNPDHGMQMNWTDDQDHPLLPPFQIISHSKNLGESIISKFDQNYREKHKDLWTIKI